RLQKRDVPIAKARNTVKRSIDPGKESALLILRRNHRSKAMVAADNLPGLWNIRTAVLRLLKSQSLTCNLRIRRAQHRINTALRHVDMRLKFRRRACKAR